MIDVKLSGVDEIPTHSAPERFFLELAVNAQAECLDLRIDDLPHCHKGVLLILLVFRHRNLAWEQFLNDLTLTQPDLPFRPGSYHDNASHRFALELLIANLVPYRSAILYRLPFRNELHYCVDEHFVIAPNKIVTLGGGSYFTPLLLDPTFGVSGSLDGNGPSHSINSISCSE